MAKPAVAETVEGDLLLLAGDSDLEFGSPRGAPQVQEAKTFRYICRGLGAVVLTACIATVCLRATHPTGTGALLGLSRDRAVNLWYEGGSGSYRPMSTQVTDHLWRVERMLVDASMCPAATPELAALRKSPWPRKGAGKAPPIMEIMYINMDWDKQRREFMEEQLADLRGIWKKHGQTLSWHRIAGVPASKLRKDLAYASFREKGFSKAKKPFVEGDWGVASCMYNHYKAISQVPESGDGLVVIAEDDVKISPSFLEMWERLWPYVPEEWDVLRIGWFGDHQNCSQVVNPMLDVANWQDPLEGECAYCGAQAYVVNPASKQKVLSRFERSRMTHADELLGAPTPLMEDADRIPPLKAFVVWPTLATTLLRDDGTPVFKSDRILGRDAVRGGGLKPGSPSGPEFGDLPEEIQIAIQAKVKIAEQEATMITQRADSHALEQALKKERRAEERAMIAEEQVQKLREEVQFKEDNYYMLPKYVHPVYPPSHHSGSSLRTGDRLSPLMSHSSAAPGTDDGEIPTHAFK